MASQECQLSILKELEDDVRLRIFTWYITEHFHVPGSVGTAIKEKQAQTLLLGAPG